MTSKVKIIIAAAFFLFICWIIFEANMNRDLAILSWVKLIPNGDKIGHFILYGCLAFLANLAFAYRFVKYRVLQIGGILVLTFAIGEEFTQIWISNRTFDYVDILFDVLGICGFTMLSIWISARSK